MVTVLDSTAVGYLTELMVQKTHLGQQGRSPQINQVAWRWTEESYEVGEEGPKEDLRNHQLVRKK